MLACCRKIARYVEGLDRAAFLANDLVYDAVLWILAVLGEAANNIPQAVHDAHSEIPWHAITGRRNRLIHGYGAIDDNTVWEVVLTGLPELIPQLQTLRAEAAETTEGSILS